MPVKLSWRLNFLNAVSLITIAAVVSVGGVYFVFDFYMNSLSRELLSNWVQSEAVAIEESNLLTSITKSQRSILASQFVKGVAIFDTSQNPPMPFIEIGNKISPEPVFLSTNIGSVQVFDNSFFNKRAVYRVPSRPSLVLVFDVESVFLQRFFFATVIALLFFIAILFLGIKTVQRVEFLRRENFLKRALSDLVDNDSPSQFVEDELPLVVRWWKQKKAESEAVKRLAIENERKILLGDLAAQVAHDIGTPISALQQILTDDDAIDRDLINAELERMKSLMEKMLRQYRGETEPELVELFDLLPLISTVLVEAKALARDKCQIASNLVIERIYVAGIKSDLSSALSNIVKNAIEAIDVPSSCVTISVGRSAAGFASILISDTGCGIPEENLSSVFERDVSFKYGGTGLGLFQAKSAIKAMKGEIKLQSTVGKGTTVDILLPIVQAEKCPIVSIGPDTQVVMVDDENIIHDLWRKILPPEIPAKNLHFLFSSEAFRTWIATNQGVNSVFLMDHDLSKDGGETGIQLIDEFGLHNSSLLVTGRANEVSIRQAARDKGIRLMDKVELSSVKFDVIRPIQMVLIDDNRANRIAWAVQAKRAGCTIETFASGAEFFEVETRIDRTTPVYVDYFFDGQAHGGILAEHLIRAGFSNVFLATEYAREKITLPQGVRGIVSKVFPSDLTNEIRGRKEPVTAAHELERMEST